MSNTERLSEQSNQLLIIADELDTLHSNWDEIREKHRKHVIGADATELKEIDEELGEIYRSLQPETKRETDNE